MIKYRIDITTKEDPDKKASVTTTDKEVYDWLLLVFKGRSFPTDEQVNEVLITGTIVYEEEI